ncbi:MAG TPA: S8 family serine peptidase, partial [Verrucomicrobiae bacterium]|nr:S8 family serine peptidase [Verrucomicrobiae bacterium]
MDDVNGWDFVNNDNRPQDDNRHGTHVSGIIAARGNNAVGVAGVSWSAKIMPLKFLSATGSGSTANSIRALEYAVANGAKISNNSWGGGASSQALADAITAAERAGHLFIAAAGNNNGNNNDTSPTYPASYNNANVISVAATTNTDALASFSNIGARSVDVGAPGASILSTVTNSGYANLSGTSMATPVVSGIAALLLSVNPNLSAAQIKTAILNNVDRIPSLANRTVTGGRVNAARALASVGSAPTNPTPAPTVAVTPANRTVAAGGQLQFTAAGGTAPYTWRVSNAQGGTINQNTGQFVAGTTATTVAVIATDASGAQGQTNVTVTALGISPATAQIAVSQQLSFTASGGTAPYTWSSSNQAVASIATGTGVLTAVAPGTVTVTARDANNATVTSGAITVAAQATPITISPQSRILGVGDSVTFTAAGGAAPFTWRSSNAAVVSVNGSGVATGISAGTASITVTGANGLSASSGNLTV